MVQKVLGVWFFASIIVLSYIATIHIVTSHVGAKPERPDIAYAEPERVRPEPVLSGPVYLHPVAKNSSGMKIRYRKPVKKSSGKNWNQIGVTKKKATKKLTKKHTKKNRALSSTSN